MIRKTLLFTILLLICWSYFLKFKPISISQHQWQDNIISAEKFLFDIDSVNNLIIGTSLARRLRMDSLPNFYNLSFGGQSIYDGLNVLNDKKKIPENIFIEINFIDGYETLNFKQIMSSPVLNVIKNRYDAFRTDKQPLAYIGKGLFYPIINKFFDKIIYKARNDIKIEHQKNKMTDVKKIDNSIFNKMLDIQKISYSKNIDSSYINQQFRALKDHVHFLESKQVNVFFFEMPVNPELLELNRAKYIRNRVKNNFPKNDFIDLPSDFFRYKTGDGIHLTRYESMIYTSYFKKEVINIISKNNKK